MYFQKFYSRIFFTTIVYVMLFAHQSFAKENNYKFPFERINELTPNQPDSAIQMIEDLLLKPNLEDSIIANANYHLGLAYYYKGFYYLSADYYQYALQSGFAMQNNEFKSKCLNNQGITFELTDRYTDALNNYLQSMEIDESKGNKYGAAQSKINIGLLYINMKQPIQAEKILKEALLFFENINDDNGQALAWHNLGVIKETSSDHKTAISYFNNALDFYKKAENSFQYVNLTIELSKIYARIEKSEKSLKLINQARDIALKNNYSYLLVRADLAETEIHLKLGDLSKASYLLKSIDPQNLTNQSDKLYLNLSITSQLNDLEKFETEFGEYKNLIDSISIIKNNRIVNEMNIKYDTEKRIRKIETQQEQIKQANRNLIIVAIALLMMTILVIAILFYNRKLQRSYRALYQKELQKSNSYLIDIEEDKTTDTQFQTSKNNETESGNLINLWKNILKLMKKDELFLNPNLTIDKVAAETSSNTKYIYHAIKNYANQNFVGFVNQFRVEKAKQLMLQYPEHTFEVIADMSGFNSSSSFYRIFRDKTGLTPGKFKILSKEDAKKAK